MSILAGIIVQPAKSACTTVFYFLTGQFAFGAENATLLIPAQRGLPMNQYTFSLLNFLGEKLVGAYFVGKSVVRLVVGGKCVGEAEDVGGRICSVGGHLPTNSPSHHFTLPQTRKTTGNLATKWAPTPPNKEKGFSDGLISGGFYS